MRVIYITNNQTMEMEAPDVEISIPYIVQIYPALQTVRLIIADDPEESKKALKKQKRKADKFIFYKGDMKYTGGPAGSSASWNFDNWPEETGEWTSAIHNAVNNRLGYWLKTQCDYMGYTALENTVSMGRPFYYTDTHVIRMSNAVVNLMGTGTIHTNGIHNCLFYVHGNYEVL